MTAIEFLELPQRMLEEIQNDVDDLAYMRSVVEKVTVSLSFTAGRGEKDPRAFENTMVDIKTEEDRIWEKTARLKQVIHELVSLINQIQDGNMRNLLKMRYIRAMTWSEIAAELPVGNRYVYTVHRKALAEFEKIWKIHQQPAVKSSE